MSDLRSDDIYKGGDDGDQSISCTCFLSHSILQETTGCRSIYFTGLAALNRYFIVCENAVKRTCRKLRTVQKVEGHLENALR